MVKTKGPGEAAGGRDQQAPPSARKAAGAGGALKVSPAGAGPGRRGSGERLGRPWGGAGERRLFPTFVSRSAALRLAGGRVGGVFCPPENAGPCHPGAGVSEGFAAATGLDFLWMRGRGSPAD